MIKLYDQVPTVYLKASRDFQYLSWLINIVLNSVKHNVDDMYYLPQASNDPKLVELLALTLGFKIKRQYDQKQLLAIVKVLPKILRTKGTIYSVFLAANALVKAAGDNTIPEVDLNNNVLEILLPSTVKDTILLFDLLPYIIPAGISCKITRSKPKYKTIRENYTVNTDNIQHDSAKDAVLSQLCNLENNYNVINKLKLLNIGLFENQIIPANPELTFDDLQNFLESENEP